MIEAREIERLVMAALPGARARARDLTGTLDHYELLVVSDVFAAKSLVERHRLIYAALAEPLRGPLHAVTIKTLTPEEANKQGV
jgi:acid stress-induced BolA-like protein IbaG/YrbA